MNLNIPEILVANGTAAAIVLFLLIFRFRQHQTHQPHEQLFSAMLFATLLALACETTSFLVDGVLFPGCHFIQYLSNFICIGMTVTVGFLWCLYVDQRIHCNIFRLRRKALFLCPPLVLELLLLSADLAGAGLIFSITPENRYLRGDLSFITYFSMFFYYIESILNAKRDKNSGISPFFFPAHIFVVPFMVGTVLQGAFYGLATGWLSAAVASVFIYIELQTANSYTDPLSGLFNRQYMNHYLSQSAKRGRKLHGIMLDINDFKTINDLYGHATGDRAIQTMGRLLSESLLPTATAIRLGGDEFVVLLSTTNPEECKAQMTAIQEQLDRFNNTKTEPFHLSASMGSASFDGRSSEDFLSQMDSTMYQVKRDYHGKA